MRLPASAAGPAVVLENRSGYDARDLAAFLQRGLGAAGVRRPKRAIVTASPIYTRGCAAISPDVAGAGISIAIAAPNRFRLAKLARIVEHEARHLLGEDHGDMPARHVYTSAASVPRWARGLSVRYVGRAPPQLPRLGEAYQAHARDGRRRRRRASRRRRW